MEIIDKSKVTEHRSVKLSGIEAARGIAAIMVVFYHAARHLKADIGYLPWGGVSQFGHSGVDFFFVLSGFIIFFVHRTDLGKPSGLPQYFERRFTRIYPYFWFSLIVGMGLVLLSTKNKTLDPVFLLLQATLLPMRGDVGVAWTLQHEILFYLFFAIAIFNRRIGFCLGSIWVIFVVAMWGGHLAPDTFPVIQKLASPFNIEFLFGILAAYVVQSGRLNWFKTCAVVGGILFVCFGIAENLGEFNGYEPSSQLAYGLASALIVMGIATAEMRSKLKMPKILAEVGSASYSIYLFHLPCIGVTYKLLSVAGLLTTIPVSILYSILVAAGVIGGVVLSRTIEHPILRTTRDVLRKARGLSGKS